MCSVLIPALRALRADAATVLQQVNGAPLHAWHSQRLRLAS